MPHCSSLVLPAAALCLRASLALPVAADLEALFDVFRSASTAPPGADGASANQELSGPRVAPQWSAAVLYSSHKMGLNFTDGFGRFLYDAVGQRHRRTVTTNVTIFYPNGTQVVDRLSANTSAGTSFNMTVGAGRQLGVCMPVTGPYFDIFGWTQGATRNGSAVIRGEQCTIWANEAVAPSPMGELRMHFSACLGTDGVPREFTQAYFSAKGSGLMTYRFFNIKIGDPGDASFQNSEACASDYPAMPCQDSGVRTIDLYRIWGPPEPLELTNRDAGDVLGDLSFLCTQASGEAYRSKLITRWSVQVSSAFGQYALCNYDGQRNRCAGEAAQLARVGRRGSQMQGGPAGGQCSSNADIGSQYSFPAEARCADGVTPTAKGCTWAAATPLRTVRASCVLEERGLQAACAEEFGHAPFRRSAGIFEAAFESDDPSKGGCPDALPPSRASVII